ncbi:MAG: GlsB/YeaQ/YmgE family stress response membrane protein [Chloroflexota bacterium]
MGILSWIVLGLLAGVLAKAVMPGRDPGGIIVTILLGIAGAVVGGFIAVALGIGDGVNNFDIGSILTAMIGAIVLLLGYRMVFSSSR